MVLKFFCSLTPYVRGKLKPSKLTWTAMYRKQHNKAVKSATKKPYSRSILTATLEAIQKKRAQRSPKFVMQPENLHYVRLSRESRRPRTRRRQRR